MGRQVVDDEGDQHHDGATGHDGRENIPVGNSDFIT